MSQVKNQQKTQNQKATPFVTPKMTRTTLTLKRLRSDIVKEPNKRNRPKRDKNKVQAMQVMGKTTASGHLSMSQITSQSMSRRETTIDQMGTQGGDITRLS